ncbi:hypothetical protein SAXI111661_16935 [Saccharomonospora xinjiangensis]|uniref:Uncharacterized protein n=1 Tax=Saccharomonospora xinjiangensis XJ-54 TaxID=882086 RepID=I0V3D2_9PSEU|nr:hypothetical protein [Saccharomonospora xinjiangensis]EID54635.1 hypothetical protein SacxiDRAFT_2410 [Saccharomonospora xinjiangensis XJ-54]QBQ62404.1 hypothetical protein EYD13_20355 [Saccharomonospora xinjiangensis]
MSLEELRHLLAGTLGAVAEARAHSATAKELLDDYRRVAVEAQAQAQPWLPSELARAVEQIEANHARLDTVRALLTDYESRL